MLEDLFADDDAPEQTGGADYGSTWTAAGGGEANPPEPPRAEAGFVGLKNQGATCYLNSLLQALYMTPELRHGLYRVTPEELGVEGMPADGEAKPAAADGDAPPAGPWACGACTLENDAADQVCAICGTSKPPQAPAAAFAAEEEEEDGKPRARMIPLEVQRLFATLQLGDVASTSTRRLTERGFEWSGGDGRVQHDVQELNRKLIDAIEQSLVRTSGADLMSQLYRGRFSNQTRCTVCPFVSMREEAFYDLTVNVQGMENVHADLVEALFALTEMERLEGDNQYFCDSCGAKVDALRGMALHELPPVLIFGINRYTYNRRTFEREKLNTRFEFPLELDMAPFSEAERTSLDALPREEALAQLRGRTVSVPDAYSGQGSADGGGNPYELFAVVIHRGDAYSGHYTAYIRSELDEGQWVPLTGDEPALQSDAPIDGDGGPLPVLRAVFAKAPVSTELNIPVLKFNALGSKVKACNPSGKPWSKEFKEAHGGLRQFLTAHDDLFLMLEGGQSVGYVGGAAAAVGEEEKKEEKQEEEKQTQEDQDAALARSLAQEEHAAEGWQTVGDANSAAQEAQANAESALQKLQKAKDEAQAKKLIEQAVADRHGRWFHFDDARVHPIRIQDIAGQFEGRASAYMLVYRSKALDSQSVDRVPPPLRWVDEVQAENEALRTAREEFDTASHQLTVTLHRADEFTMRGLHLVPKAWGAAAAGAAPEGEALTVDTRTTLTEFRAKCGASAGLHVLAARGREGFWLYDGVEDADGKEVGAKDSGLKEGMHLLVWDGERIDGQLVRAGAASEPLRVRVTVLRAEEANNELEVFLPKDATADVVKTVLSEATGIPVASVDAYSVVLAASGKLASGKLERVAAGYGGRAGGSKAQEPTLASWGVADNSLMLVESSAGRSGRALAHGELQRLKQLMVVTVADLFTGQVDDGKLMGDTSRHVTLTLPRQTTLQELKLLVLGKLVGAEEVEVGLAATRLRRTEGGAAGAIFDDEAASLAQANVKDGSTLCIEGGEPLDASQLLVKYVVLSGNDTALAGGGGERSEAREITVPASAPLGELKALICAEVGVDVATKRLRATNWVEEACDLVRDETKTFAQAQLNKLHVLLLEDGTLPKKGVLALRAYLWLGDGGPDALAGRLEAMSIEASNAVAGGAEEEEEKKEEKEEEAEDQPDARDVARAERRAALQKLPDFEVSADATLLQLRERLAAMVGEDVAPACIRIRELTVEAVPGRAHRDDSRTLKKLHIQNDKPLVVEVLSEPEALNNTTQLLWLQRGVNSGGGEFANVPAWPPVALRWDPGPSPQLPQLQAAVADALGLDPAHMVLAKYQSGKNSWHIIKEPKQGNARSGKKKRKAARKPPSLLDSPCTLRCGDLIVARDPRDWESASAEEMLPEQFLRPEDLCAQQELEAIREAKRLAKTRKKARGPEVDLVIGGDLSF